MGTTRNIGAAVGVAALATFMGAGIAMAATGAGHTAAPVVHGARGTLAGVRDARGDAAPATLLSAARHGAARGAVHDIGDDHGGRGNGGPGQGNGGGPGHGGHGRGGDGDG